MTKEEMLKEIKFPILAPPALTFISMLDKSIDINKQPSFADIPVADAWIGCFFKTEKDSWFGVYKWQKENNPKEIYAWCYIDIEATHGIKRYVEYKHIQHEKIIVLCDEKEKDFIIE